MTLGNLYKYNLELPEPAKEFGVWQQPLTTREKKVRFSPHKSDAEKCKIEMLELYKDAKSKGKDIKFTDYMDIIVKYPAITSFMEMYDLYYKPWYMVRPDCLVPLNDLYIACSYQRFTELIVCMMNIIEKGYFDFAEAQAPKAWVGNDGKIRVYDGAHRILMCYLIGLECAFVDLQRHEVGISREVEKEREALAFVGDNSRTKQIPWYQNWQAYLDYNKETEEYKKSKMLLDFFITAKLDVKDADFNLDYVNLLNVRESGCKNLIDNSQPGAIPSEKKNPTSHYDFFGTESALKAVSLWRSVHGDAIILTDEFDALSRFFEKIKRYDLFDMKITDSSFKKAYKNFYSKKRNAGDLARVSKKLSSTKTQTLDYDIVKRLKLHSSQSELNKLRKEWNPSS